MQILTIYVGQGALAVVRHLGEAVVVDSRLLEDRADDITRQLDLFLKDQAVVGLVLTGFDDDHADPKGVDYILTEFEPDWVMYPKCYKDTDNANDVFRVIRKHERRRARTHHPLRTVSVRLDDLDSRILTGLSQRFEYELFSPHTEDMDNSNNCSIVVKLRGVGGSTFTYLITGDTENERWESINRFFGTGLKSDVLAAPHHGSKNAANSETTLLVSPNTVLISAGVDNQYGHPDPQAVRMYCRVAKHVFQTNVGDGVSLHTKRQGDDFVTRLVRNRSTDSKLWTPTSKVSS